MLISILIRDVHGLPYLEKHNINKEMPYGNNNRHGSGLTLENASNTYMGFNNIFHTNGLQHTQK